MNSVATLGLWSLFGTAVVGLLAVDFFVCQRRPQDEGPRGALAWSIVWIAAALMFSGFVYLWLGSGRGHEFLTGYFIEKALAVDNLFVFALIFEYFGIPARRQHKVLFWGVFGALAFRAIFVVLGSSLLTHFHWVAYIFGAFLLLTGVKLLRNTSQMHPETNSFFRVLRKVIPTTNADSDDFFVRKKTKLVATPLFLAVVLVEISDLVFAVDSIPAVFAVTSDPFIVFASNVFAVLGLRAMYSLLADFIVQLRYLRVGLALVLVFVGTKMLIQSVYEIPILVSLAAVVVLLAGSAAASFVSGAATQATSGDLTRKAREPHGSFKRLEQNVHGKGLGTKATAP